MAGRGAIAARSSVLCVREAARMLGLELGGVVFAVNGFGDAGSSAARYMGDMGCKMVACDDFVGGAYSPDGMDPADVAAWKSRRGTVKGYPGSVDIKADELYTLPVNVVVAAGLPDALTEEVALNVSAKIIVEAVEGPVSPAAEEILRRRGVLVIPDILSSDRSSLNLNWTAEEVEAHLEKIVVDWFTKVFDCHKR